MWLQCTWYRNDMYTTHEWISSERQISSGTNNKQTKYLCIVQPKISGNIDETRIKDFFFLNKGNYDTGERPVLATF